MKVPLTAKHVGGDNEKIRIWRNGKKEEIDPPILPYFYSKKDIKVPATREKVNKICLSDFQERSLYKYNFKTVQLVPKYRRKGITYEDNIPFIIRVRIDVPDFYYKFPNNKELKTLFLDIEQYTPKDSFFPTYQDRIISIAYCTNERKMKYLSIKKDTKTDKDLLKYFINDFNKINPDVVVLYNKSYDIPTIIRRCEENKIDTTPLTRDSSKPYFSGNTVRLEGRAIYDVFDSVSVDQSLTGNVPNRGLKAVSNYFGFKTNVPVLDTSKTYKYVGTKELKMYNVDDVKRLLFLYDIYFLNIYKTAEQLKIPLEYALDINTTDLGNIILGEKLKQLNVVSDGVNRDRYPEIFDTGEGGKFQGALTGIKKQGLFKPVINADYSSMYPNIISKFNLSPDTCRIEKMETFRRDGFKIVDGDGYYLYYIPDTQLKKVVVLKVLKEDVKEGFITALVRQFLDSRAKYKKKYKETKKKIYKALSDIEKVKANGGIYGIQGTPNHPFGYAPIALLTTGLGREGIKLLIKTLEEIYPNSVIEWDTDGVYFSTENVDEKEITKHFKEKIIEHFKRDIDLDIGFEHYDGGYFYKQKNYVLQKGDVLTVKGAAMKGRHRDNLSKNFINDISKVVMNGGDIQKVIQKYENLRDFPLEDFAMSTTQSRELNKYKSRNSLSFRMAQKAEHHLKRPPQIGNQYHYIKTLYDYELFELAKKTEIDYKYYKKKIKQMTEMFQSNKKIKNWNISMLNEDIEEKDKVANLGDFY